MSKAKTLSSDVMVELDGDEYPLRSSLRAATAISNHFGGFIAAYQHLANGNLQAYQFIIRNGIPKADQRNISTEELNEMIWRKGTVDLVGPVSKYLGRLQHGGRDPDEDVSHADDGDEGNGEI